MLLYRSKLYLLCSFGIFTYLLRWKIFKAYCSIECAPNGIQIWFQGCSLWKDIILQLIFVIGGHSFINVLSMMVISDSFYPTLGVVFFVNLAFLIEIFRWLSMYVVVSSSPSLISVSKKVFSYVDSVNGLNAKRPEILKSDWGELFILNNIWTKIV